jgi:hypothetical protein
MLAYQIPVSACEEIRDNLATMIALELKNQFDTYDEAIFAASVFADRDIPYSEADGIGFVTINLSGTSESNHTPATYDSKVSIDILVNLSVLATDDTYGDVESRRGVVRLCKAIEYILQSCEYYDYIKTGNSVLVTQQQRVTQVAFGNPFESQDSINCASGRVSLEIDILEQNIQETANLIAGVDFIAKFENNNTGFKVIIQENI